MPSPNPMPAHPRTLLAAPPAPGAAGSCARRWVPIRRLHDGHRPRVLSHLLALDDDDRVRRFGLRASDELIAHYVDQLDFRRDHVFGTFDRRLELLTLGHLALDPEGRSAEFAVSILSRARGRGLGTQLFTHAVTHARNRGVQTLFLHLARDNTPMMAIVQHAGALIDFDGADATAELALQAHTLGTQIEELIARQAAGVDFRFKRHALRLDALKPGKGPTS